MEHRKTFDPVAMAVDRVQKFILEHNAKFEVVGGGVHLNGSKAGYQKIQQTRPQTLGYGLTDSPTGQLAWNAELWTGWGDYADYLDVDTYLTHVSIYWFTRTGVSSARHYYEDARSGAGYRDAPNKVPTAVAVFPQDFRTIRTFAERANNIVRYTEFDRGGHFAYTTDPDLVAGDLREFFADLG